MHRFPGRFGSFLALATFLSIWSLVGCGYERFDLEWTGASSGGASGGESSVSTGGISSGGSGGDSTGTGGGGETGGSAAAGGTAGSGASGGGGTGGSSGGGSGGATSGSGGGGGSSGAGGTGASGGTGPGCQGPDCCCKDISFGCPPGTPCYCEDTSACPLGYVCDAWWHQCLYACGNCPSYIPLCDESRGACVNCLGDRDCDRPGQHCVEGICVNCRDDCL